MPPLKSSPGLCCDPIMTAIQKTSWKAGVSLFVAILLISALVFWLAAGVLNASRSPLGLVQVEYALVSKDCWFTASEDVVTVCGEVLTPSVSGQFRLPYVILSDTSI